MARAPTRRRAVALARGLLDAQRMKKNSKKLRLGRETVRNLSTHDLTGLAGALAKPSTDTDCVYCPLYSIPINQCPMISREVVCKKA